MRIPKQSSVHLEYLRTYFVSKTEDNLINADLTPGATLTQNLGTSAKKWNTLYVGTVYADSISGGGGGASNFLALSDTPSSYTSQQYKFTRVNSGETALEFASLVAGNGLTLTNGAGTATLDIGAGALITVAADTVSVSNGASQWQVPITGSAPFTPVWTSLSSLAGNGLTWSTDSFAINLATNPGLQIATDQLSILLDTNPGLVIGAGGLKILLPGSSGLQLGAGGLSIDLDTNPGLSIGAGGISVGAGTLITVSGGTVSLSNGGAQYQVPVTGSTPFTPAWTALSTFAGAGIGFTGGAFEITAGTLITVGADSVGLSNGAAQYQVPVTGSTPFTPAWTNLSSFAGAGIGFTGGAFAITAGTLITVGADSVGLSNGSAQYQVPITGTTPFTPAWTNLSTLAGNGLTFSAGFQVGAGTLISVAADTVSLSNGSAQYQVPVTGATPFTPAWTALSTYAGDGIAWSANAYAINLAANSGLQIATDALSLGTPTTLTVATSNAVSGTSHSHAITSSSNPGASASLLASDASGYLQLVRLGVGVTPSYPLHIQSTSTALRLQYDGSNRANFTITSTGTLQIDSIGNMELNPIGNYVTPNITMDNYLGSPAKQWLGIYAGELNIGTIVSDNITATVGGDIVVAPTTKLAAAIDNATTTITTDHNNLAVNDFIFLRAGGNFEAMQIATGPTGTGPYTYTVTRNVDASGANSWNEGDTIVNTGYNGDGFLNIFSARNFAGSAFGPTMVGYTRTSTAWANYAESFAVGNLNTLYGYGVDIYGVALGLYSGEYVTIEPTNGIQMYSGGNLHVDLDPAGILTLGYVAGGEYVTVDGTNGIEMYSGGTKYVSVTTSGVITLGVDAVGGERLTIDATNGLRMYANNTRYVDLTNAGILTLGHVVGGEYMTVDGTNGIEMYVGSSRRVQITAGGNMVLGDVSNEHIRINATSVGLWDGGTEYTNLSGGVLTLGDDGAGGEYVTVDAANGIRMFANATQYVSLANTGSLTLGNVAGGEYVTVDGTNGIEMFSGGTQLVDITVGGIITVGQAGADRVVIESAAGIQMYGGATQYVGLTSAGVLTLGNTAGGEYVQVDGTNGLQMYSGGTKYVDVTTAGVATFGSTAGGEYLTIDGTNGIRIYGGGALNFEANNAGDVTLGNVATNQANVKWDNTTNRLQFRGGTSGTEVKSYINTDGQLVFVSSGSIEGNIYWHNGTANHARIGNLWNTGSSTSWLTLEAITPTGGLYAEGLLAASGVGGAGYAWFKAHGQTSSNEWAEVHAGKTLTVDPNGMEFSGDAQFAGGLYIGSTVGTTIGNGSIVMDQGGLDSIIMQARSSDVAHGMTNLSSTDTYFSLAKLIALSGGALLYGYSEGSQAIQIVGAATSDNTLRSTSAVGAVALQARKKDGLGVNNMGTNANLVVIYNNVTARALFDAEGDLHLDATSNINAWDDHDDMALLTGLRASVMDPRAELAKRSAQWIEYARPVLEATGVMTYNDDGHHFVSMKNLQWLQIDAMRQMHERIQRQEEKIARLERQLAAGN